MIRDSRLVAFWRAANASLNARRWPPLTMGVVQKYWNAGFSPECAADLEMLRAILPPRTLH